MQAKQYGKLTAQQFKALIDLLPEVRRLGEDFRTAVGATPKLELDAVLVSGYHWGAIYEHSFHRHVAVVAYALGLSNYVRWLARQPDPQESLLEDVQRNDLVSGEALAVEKQHAIGLVYSLQRTILSVMLYGRSMSSLVQDVRESGSSDALFKAIRVDRSCMVAPSIADRIARAELRRDESFFRHLRSALRGPQKKAWEAFYDLRYALAVLRELGLSKLSDAQLEHLLIDTLHLYSPTASARKNLRAQYQKSRRIRTI